MKGRKVHLDIMQSWDRRNDFAVDRRKHQAWGRCAWKLAAWTYGGIVRSGA